LYGNRHKGRDEEVNIREEINRFAESDAVIISHHARVRMFERNISTDDL